MRSDQKDILDRDTELEQKLEKSAPIVRLTRYGHRNRLGIIVALGLVIFDLVGTAFIALGWEHINQAQHKASQAVTTAQKAREEGVANSSALYALCLSNNFFRAEDKQRWDDIATKFTATPATPAEQQKINSFLAYIAKVDAPKQCPPKPTGFIPPVGLEAPSFPFSSTTTTTKPPTIITPAPRVVIVPGTSPPTTRFPTTTTTAPHPTTTTTSCRHIVDGICRPGG